MVRASLGHQPAAYIMLAITFQDKFWGFPGSSLENLLKFLGTDTLALAI
jgi:hypothetical protein